MIRQDEIWKTDTLARTFLGGVRGGLPFAAEQIDIILRLIDALGRTVGSFMDLGCGDGILAQAVLTRYPDAAGVLVDFSLPMLDAARARFHGSPAALDFVQADFGEPGWVDAVAARAPYAVVVSGLAIHHQTDHHKQRIYAEILHLLTPGGLFVNVEHVASPNDWLARLNDGLLLDSLYRFHSASGSGMTRDEVAAQYIHRPDKAANILAPLELQCAWLRDLGYVDVDCYFKAFEMAVFGGRRPGD